VRRVWRGWFGLAAVVLLLSGCAKPAPAAVPVTQWSQNAPGIEDDGGASTPPEESPSPSPSPSPSASAKPKASRKPVPAVKTSGPATGSVVVAFGHTFVVAAGGTGIHGTSGRLMRYKVAVESGLPESTSEVASAVDEILGNTTRGWSRGGQWRFQRVYAGPVDFVVELATAATTTDICNRYGLRTGGKVSCRGGQNVVINLTRWRQGTDGSGSDAGGATVYSPTEYRALVVNHEVGHALGHGHVPCPGSGRSAPVMMTQFFGIGGCAQNIWPFAEDGSAIG